MRLYLDRCAIQRPPDDQSQVRVRAESEAVLGLLALCPSGAVILLASGAHDVEIGRCPLPDRRDHVERVLRLATVYLPLTADIERQARRFHGDAQIGRLDAFHLAAALAGQADFFCTTDDRLLRKARRADTGPTCVVSPLESVARLPSREPAAPMTVETRPFADLNRAGHDALVRELGVVGAIRFLSQFTTGRGDYTAERESFLPDLSMDEFAREIREADRRRASSRS